MKKPILKTKRTVRASKKATSPPANRTKAAWKKAEAAMPPFPPELQAKAEAIMEKVWPAKMREIAREAQRSMLEWQAKDNRRRLHIDPTARHDDFLASMFGWLWYGKPTEADRKDLGEYLVIMSEDLTPDELETAFAAIVRMKRAAEKDKAGTLGRYSKWAALRSVFKKRKGRDVECKQEFEQYAADNNLPMPASYSGKTPIWKLLGMKDFPQKRNAKK